MTTEPDFAGLSFNQWCALGRDRNSLLTDPLFVCPAKFDFRLKPDSPAAKVGFQPFDTAAAGQYGEPDWVDRPKKIVRATIPLPPVPNRGPQPIDDGFESTPVGDQAALAVTSGEGKGASIRVTDEAAAAGKHCLKFTDAAGLKYDWQPHLYYQPGFATGAVRVSYDVRLEPGAIFLNEWRDASSPYLVGPSITVDPAGRLLAGGKLLTSVPIGQWIRFEFVTALGKQATGTYDLTVTPSAQPPRTFQKLPVGKPGWNRLSWLGFNSLAKDTTVIYLDNVKVGAP